MNVDSSMYYAFSVLSFIFLVILITGFVAMKKWGPDRFDDKEIKKN